MPYTKQEINALLDKPDKMLNHVMSEIDKIDSIEVLEDGRVRHKMLRITKPNKNFQRDHRKWRSLRDKANPDKEPLRYSYGNYREWKNIAVFKKWRNKLLKDREEHLKKKLSPLQQYIAFGQGSERPFTGEHWWTKDVGQYSCAVCTQNLFMNDHKF